MMIRGVAGIFMAVDIMTTAPQALAQDRDAQPLNQPQPVYPFLAAMFGVQGACDVRFSVDEAGLPFGLRTSCTAPVFCHEAERAVSRVRFLPKILDGHPAVRPNIIYPLQFLLGVETEDDNNRAQEWLRSLPTEPCEEIAVA